MPIVIDGTGSITGISAGGLPDNSVTTDDIASSAVTVSKIDTTVSQLFGMRNRIINGEMVVSQRGSTSTTVSAYAYGVDRFGAYESTSATSVTATQSSTAPAGFINSLLYTVGTGGTATAAQQAYIRTKIEGYNIADLDFGKATAKTITISFWVRSSLTGTYCVSLTNAAQNRSYVSTYTINTANTFEYKTITIAGDTSGTWLTTNGIGIELGFDLGGGSNYNTTANAWAAGAFYRTSAQANLIGTTGATFYITGVQLEVGSTATPFERRPYGQELINCQRYYYRITATAPYQLYGSGFAEVTTLSYAYVKFPVTMRTNPTALESDGNNGHYWIIFTNQSTTATATPSFYQTMSTEGCGVNLTCGALLTQGNGLMYRLEAIGAYLGWSAEL